MGKNGGALSLPSLAGASQHHCYFEASGDIASFLLLLHEGIYCINVFL
jgi:hypothetical protein